MTGRFPARAVGADGAFTMVYADTPIRELAGRQFRDVRQQ